MTLHHRMSTGPLLVAAAFLGLASPLVADDCDYTETLRESVEAGGASVVKVEAEAGSLKIVGRAGAGEVRVRGEACASRESLLEDIELTVRSRGDQIRIVAKTPDGGWLNSTARLDLEIELPSHLAVEVNDGSGSIDVREVASLQIDDGSGEILVMDVAGDLRINDGSGSIEAQDVAGEIVIEDGSGSIDIRRAGSVLIEDDGSGSIRVADVAGDVYVDDDGSGSISVRGVGGDFTVRDDGSGGISHQDVAGRVSVPSDD